MVIERVEAEKARERGRGVVRGVQEAARRITGHDVAAINQRTDHSISVQESKKMIVRQRAQMRGQIEDRVRKYRDEILLQGIKTRTDDAIQRRSDAAFSRASVDEKQKIMHEINEHERNEIEMELHNQIVAATDIAREEDKQQAGRKLDRSVKEVEAEAEFIVRKVCALTTNSLECDAHLYMADGQFQAYKDLMALELTTPAFEMEIDNPADWSGVTQKRDKTALYIDLRDLEPEQAKKRLHTGGSVASEEETLARYPQSRNPNEY